METHTRTSSQQKEQVFKKNHRHLMIWVRFLSYSRWTSQVPLCYREIRNMKLLTPSAAKLFLLLSITEKKVKTLHIQKSVS